MFENLKSALRSKEQPESFNENDWHLDIRKYSVERKFLASQFPKEIQIVRWINTKPSKIDREYYDISWTMESETKGRPGLFIAFMHKDKFKVAFKNIGKAPEELCDMRVNIVIAKHDIPADRKSHPKWGCWLEVTDAKFINWEPEE